MKKSLEILMAEHRVIEQVLECLEKMVAQCRAAGRLDGESARQAIDFFQSYADRGHHGKEEIQLFPLLETRGLGSPCGPLAVMQREHIGKEDHCLFTTADRSLSDEDDQQLLKTYEQFEAADLGHDANDRYVAIANQLADRYGVPRAG